MPATRILCVDDNRDICILLERILVLEGFEAICATDAVEALRLVRTEQFKLYILDAEMPGTSGLTLCQLIRAYDEHAPIIIYSAHSDTSDRLAGMVSGANAYVAKPRIEELVPTIKGLLGAADVMT
jgi:two-component system phosphate regulon response regulator OmpR